MTEPDFFPELVTSLPPADIPIDGLKAYILQSADQQVVFMSFSADAEVPEHSHEAQWGVVLEGELELTVSGETRVYRKGDVYYVPRGVRHSARIKAGYKDLCLFDQNERYKARIPE